MHATVAKVTPGPDRFCVRSPEGWPTNSPRYAQGEEFESEDQACYEAARGGYLWILGQPLDLTDEERATLGRIEPIAGDDPHEYVYGVALAR